MRFYIYYRFPIGFVFSLFSIFTGISLLTEWNIYYILIICFDSFIYIFRFFVYYNIKELSKKGYNLNYILIVCESISLAITNLIAGIIPGTIWLTFNIIYFKKREYIIHLPLKDNKFHTINDEAKATKPKVYNHHKINRVFKTSLIITVSLIFVMLFIYFIGVLFYNGSSLFENIINILLITSVLFASISALVFVITAIFLIKYKAYSKSIRYRIRCYKKVEKIQKYLEKGIISEEEFEKDKKEILKHIEF